MQKPSAGKRQLSIRGDSNSGHGFKEFQGHLSRLIVKSRFKKPEIRVNPTFAFDAFSVKQLTIPSSIVKTENARWATAVRSRFFTAWVKGQNWVDVDVAHAITVGDHEGFRHSTSVASAAIDSGQSSETGVDHWTRSVRFHSLRSINPWRIDRQGSARLIGREIALDEIAHVTQAR